MRYEVNDEDRRLPAPMRWIFSRWSPVRPLGGVTSPMARLAYAVLGGNLLYALLLLNFSIFEESLEPYAYRLAPNPEKSLLAITMISILGAVLALRVPHHRSLVGGFSHLAFVVIFVPLCAIYTLSDGATAFVASCCGALAVSFFVFGRRENIELGRLPNLDRFVMFFFLFIVLFVFINLIMDGKVRFSFLDFRDVYNLRSDMKFEEVSVSNRIITISAYTSSSFLLVYGLLYRRIFIIILSIIFSYILYNSFGLKLFLFFPFITILLYVYYMYMKTFSMILVLISVMFVVYLNEIFQIWFLTSPLDFFGQLVVRRYFYVPGYLSFAWYDTFLEEPYVYLSNVFGINKILTYPFDISHSSVVAYSIYGRDFNPNTSILSYGFANFGYIGIFIFCIFTYTMLDFIDYCSFIIKNIYIRLSSISISFLFLESDPIVVFISFGFGLIFMICIIIFLVRRRYREPLLFLA